MTKVLQDIRVVELGTFITGPCAGMMLADLGADVIKVEQPGVGDPFRGYQGAQYSSQFQTYNARKRSLALNLKSPHAKDILERLLSQADVLLENYRPGVLDKLGFGWDAVHQRHPRLVYCSVTGFGQTGPYAGRGGFDLIIQAMSGLISTTGGGAHRPTPIGSAIADQHGAALFALGIVGAYAKWLTTGQGTRVESSLLASGIDLQTESLVTYYAVNGQDSMIDRDDHLGTWFHEAPYGGYEIADGHIAISLNPPEKLARALKSDDIAALIGKNTYFERDIYAKAVAKAVKSWTFFALSEVFDIEKMWYARVDNLDDLARNPQVHYNGTFMDFDVMGVPLKLVNHPNRYDGEGAEITLSSITAVTVECYSTKEIAGIDLKRPAPWARSR
ncbi:MAG TPA: CoA transferase [Chloroflexi bacterium]|nr:CoA transferase [Chloroflexota bacterium]